MPKILSNNVEKSFALNSLENISIKLSIIRWYVTKEYYQPPYNLCYIEYKGIGDLCLAKGFIFILKISIGYFDMLVCS